MDRIPEDEMLRGHGKLVRFDFDRFDKKSGKMRPYGKGFLHADMEKPCQNPSACRDKSHTVHFTWKEVIHGQFLPVVGTRVSFVALPPVKGLAPRAIKLRRDDVSQEKYERPEKTIPRYGK